MSGGCRGCGRAQHICRAAAAQHADLVAAATRRMADVELVAEHDVVSGAARAARVRLPEVLKEKKNNSEFNYLLHIIKRILLPMLTIFYRFIF